MSKEKLRKLLQDSVVEFCESNDWDNEIIENIIEDNDSFYEYMEEHEDLKDKMYEFFRQLFDEYDSFRFHNNPIPALVESKSYMEGRKIKIEEDADNFFNFGGFKFDE